MRPKAHRSGVRRIRVWSGMQRENLMTTANIQRREAMTKPLTKGTRVSVRKEFRHRYPGRNTGVVVQETSLGIAVRVQFDRAKMTEWIEIEHLEAR